MVDNGSSDGTTEMIKSEFPSVHLIVENRRGVSIARNVGIHAARCEWIAFLDSDDEWHPEKLATQLIELGKLTPEVRVVHTDEIWIRNGSVLKQKKKHAKQGGDIFKNCLKLCCMSPSSIMLKKEIFQDFGTFDENLPACEDYDMWLRIVALERVLFVDRKLLFKYGGHEDQLSKKFWGMDRFRIYSLEKLILESNLSKTQTQLALNALIQKIRILILGGKKRGNFDLVHIYQRKLDKWTSFAETQNLNF